MLRSSLPLFLVVTSLLALPGVALPGTALAGPPGAGRRARARTEAPRQRASDKTRIRRARAVERRLRNPLGRRSDTERELQAAVRSIAGKLRELSREKRLPSSDVFQVREAEGGKLHVELMSLEGRGGYRALALSPRGRLVVLVEVGADGHINNPPKDRGEAVSFPAKDAELAKVSSDKLANAIRKAKRLLGDPETAQPGEHVRLVRADPFSIDLAASETRGATKPEGSAADRLFH